MNDRELQKRDEDEAGRRAAVEAADDTGLIHQAEILVQTEPADEGDLPGGNEHE